MAKFTDLPSLGQSLAGTEIAALVANVSSTLTTVQLPLSTIKTFVLNGTATTATNLASGGANQLAYQTAASTTGFVAAPVTTGTALIWNGTSLTWGSPNATATTLTGLLKGNGTVISAATSGTDYAPGTSALATGILKSTTSTGALSIASAGTDYIAPYTSQTANTLLAAPSGSAGVPAFRSLVAADLPSTVVVKDANNNVSLNNLNLGTTSTTSTGSGTVTMTVASTTYQVLTGTLGHNFLLPDATTLPIGAKYYFNNNSTGGSLILKNAGGTPIIIIPYGGCVEAILIANGTANGTWEQHAFTPSAVLWGHDGLTYSGYIVATATADNQTTAKFYGYSSTVSADLLQVYTYSGGTKAVSVTSAGVLTLANDIVGSATQNVFNTVSTTINAFGAATTLAIGNTATAAQTVNLFTASTGASTYNLATGATASATTKTINIGTAGVSGSTTNIAIGSSVSGATSSLTFSGSVADATLTSTAKSVGYLGMPQQSKSSAYTTVIGDAGKHIYVTATATITIDSNANVAYPIGTSIAFIAAVGATVTIAITTDTMYLGGTGTTGSRTLAAYGMATAVKVTATSWFINGTGLT